METNLETREYRPIQLPRRGEMIAWGLALLLAATWIFLALVGQRISAALPFLAILLILAAGSISLGNWMDRKTILWVGPQGIAFTNGLRNVRLGWEEIRQVQVFPSPWGKKIRVIGPQAHFDFRALGEVKIQGDVKGRMGFAEGEIILRRILESGRLVETKRPDGGGARYYSAQK